MSPTHETTYKLDQLAERAGVSPRTVRYYVQRGLLPAPAFRGRDTVYTHDHLVRLRAIRRLQDRFFPLDAIQVEIERRTPDELAELAEGRGVPSPPADARDDDEIQVVVPRPSTRGPSPYRVPVVLPARPARWSRWELAPGVELSLSDEADADARALADELRALAERRARHGGSNR